MSLDDFVGTWQEESKDGFDGFAEALELDDDKKQFFRGVSTVISYAKDGDSWKIHVGTADRGSNGMEFAVQLGVPYDSRNLDGTPMKSVINGKDGTFEEKHEIIQNNIATEMHISRTIEPQTGKMRVETTHKGMKMTSLYTRKQ